MIEIVGWSGRLPGAQNPKEFWNVLKSGKCVVSEIPDERWSKFHFWHPRTKETGKTYTFAAGVLDDIFGFDPGVFGISPREAEQMDPQQRLLLQVTWEALEDAGVSPSSIAGQDVGVYVGASGLDYGTMASFDIGAGTGHFMTGNTLSIIANRTSYIFDFRGPSFVVDTACSSSLVALREATIALEAGKIDTAIVAGVNVLLSPFPFIGFARATMLSPQGLCRAFDESAHGYVRSEGCVAIVLRRKDASPWAGQRSRADLIAADVNSDGRTVGMSLPSAIDQGVLLERIYRESGVDPEDLAFLEAHGTGTRVGDPAEAESIGTKLGRKRSKPLPIGSVKTNIGHLEPASGLAGLVKSILALENNYLPKSLHFDNPNPDIDFESLNIEVASEGKELPRCGRTRYAGVNSFGFGGTNAHVIISDPQRPVVANDDGIANNGILMLSAQSEEALKETARSYANLLDTSTSETLGDIAAAAFHRKRQFREKLVVLGKNKNELSARLHDFLNEEKSSHVKQAVGDQYNGKCAFVFAGNGAQWPGMGQVAYQNNQVFREKFDAISDVFAESGDYVLTDLLFADDLEEQLKLTSISQPMIFATQVALVAAMEAAGIKPDIVFGHSIGEAAASVAANKIALDEAVRLVYHRSNAQEKVAGKGTMAALVMPEEKARDFLTSSGFDDIEIAAINSHKSLTISGPSDDIAAFAKFARKNHVPVRPMGLNYPFHSKLIDVVEEPFRSSVDSVQGLTSDRIMISTVTAEPIEGENLGINYWWRNLREPVNFAGAIRKACELGATSFIEISPKAILQSYVKQELTDADIKGAVIATLDGSDTESTDDPILRIVAEALAQGINIDETKVFGPNPDKRIELPTYPWQNQIFQFSKTEESNRGLVAEINNPLLGWRVNETANIWNTHLDATVVPFLRDHVVSNQVIFPGAGYVEIALSAARAFYGDVAVELLDMDIISPMRLSDEHLTEVQTRLDVETGTVEISSRRRNSDEGWMLHARGRVFEAVHLDDISTDAIQGPSDTVASGSDIYDLASNFGLDYGPAFRRVRLVTKVSSDVLRVSLKPLAGAYDQHLTFGIHPAELDGCFGGLIALYRMSEIADQEGRAYVPVFFEKIQQLASGHSPEHVVLKIRKVSRYSILADFEIFDGNENCLMKIVGGRFRATTFDLLDQDKNLVLHMREKVLTHTGEPNTANALTDLINPGTLCNHLTETSNLEIGGEERESRLLLEAAVQRGAFDLISTLANHEGLVRSDCLPEAHRNYFSALLNLLVQSDEAEEVSPDVFRLSEKSSLPEFSVLLASVLEENPEEIAATTLINHAQCTAEKLLDGEEADYRPSGALIEHFQFDSPDAQKRLGITKSWLKPVIENWPSDRPIRVLDLAGSGLGIARYLHENFAPGHIEIVVCDPDASSVARLAVNIPSGSKIELLDVGKPLDEDFKARQFDLVISSGRLHGFAKRDFLHEIADQIVSDGMFVAVEPAIDLIHDAVFGLTEGWFADGLGGAFPIGRLKSADEWKKHLTDIGYGSTDVLEEVIDGTTYSLIRASVPTKTDDQTEQADLSTSTILIIASDNPEEHQCARLLQERLTALSAHARLLIARDGAFDPVDVEAWQEELKSDDLTQDGFTVVDLHGAIPEQDDPLVSVSQRTMSAIAFLKAIEERSARLIFVAPQGAGLRASEREVNAVQSAIWSFVRVMVNEAPHLNVSTVDPGTLSDSDNAVDHIVNALTNESPERELTACGNTYQAPRAERGFAPTKMRAAETVRLMFDQPGSLDALTWQEIERPELGAHDVEIEVAASGLNFRDVMWALGMLPEEALEDGYGGPSLGLECSGRVLRVGRDVTNVKVGDPVVAFTSHGFSSILSVPDIAVARISEDDDLVAAATLPVAFLTAYYSLVHLAHLKKDDWLLLHGSAGGVGLAALQIAKWIGAKVIATAGSDEKRELLDVLGADHILNSRSLDFAEQVKVITGEGVDVVLNSLAGEAMERGMNCMRPFGRFCELGKRDYYANTKVGLRPFRKNISYFGIDVDQLLMHEKSLVKGLIEDLFALIREGTFRPLPHRVFDGANAADAFRLMQRSGHIGKILVTPPKAGDITVPVVGEKLSFADNGAHIVIGGLGGFGQEITKWLADHGAQTIILTNRSGSVGDDHLEMISNLAKRGVDVRPVACDVTDRASVEQMLNDLREEMPVKGVIHAAMVLDDGIMNQLDQARFEKVLAPKITGAKNLAQLTWQDELEHFILFSSATTLIGNPGQSHYVTANGYLEGLARERRRVGRPAIAVAWGAIGDVGFLARNAEVSDKLARHLGDAMIKARKGLDLLATAMERDDGSPDKAVVYIGKFDWSSAQQTLPILKTPLFAPIVAELDDAGETGTQLDLTVMIAGKSETEAVEIISGLVAGEIATILRLPEEDIGLKRPLPDLGMDSLMGLELRMAVQKRFGIEMPLTAISGDATVEVIATQIIKAVAQANEEQDGQDHTLLNIASQHIKGDVTSGDPKLAKVQELVLEKQSQMSGLIQ